MADLKDQKSSVSESNGVQDAARREALAKMGRLAGYTAPVMMTLLGARKARAGFEGSCNKPKR